MHLLCPHCQCPIELVKLPASGDVLCESCGSTFRIESETTLTWEGSSRRILGRFELLNVVGSGAFGTVYKARDPQLDRNVAVKVPRTGNPPDGKELDRFLREARSAAQLRHPSIVPVHEVGLAEGMPYIVSDFVEGPTLADRLTAEPPSFRESAALVAKVAEALDYAHRAGVIHRDVKPSNMLLRADGEPVLMDFGLAKREAGEVTMTVDGQVLGTPAYMSPEQARGEGHAVDGRSDVYSLGVILYRMVPAGPVPPRPEKRLPRIFWGHEKATRDIAFSPDGTRLASVSDDATLRLWDAATGRTLRVFRSDGPLWRVAINREGSRVAAVGMGGVLRVWNIGDGAEVFHRLVAKKTNIVGVAFHPDGTRIAVGDAQGTIHLLHAEDGRPIRTLTGHAGGISRVRFSPDGTRLASSGEDGTVRLWDVESGRELHVMKGHSANVTGLAFRPDGSRLASSGRDGLIRVWDTATGLKVPVISFQGGGKLYSIFQARGEVYGIAYDPTGRWLASTNEIGGLKLLVGTGHELSTLAMHLHDMTGLAFSPGGDRVAITAMDGTVEVWDVPRLDDLDIDAPSAP